MTTISRSEETDGKLIIGLNPAWQKTLRFSRIIKGEVNRAETILAMAGGKGVHTAKACRHLNHTATLVQFAGGRTGEMLTRDLDQRRIRHLTVATNAATRTCTTLLDRADNSMTELIEPSPHVTAREVDELRRQLFPLLSAGRALALCGTMPGGVSTDLYRDIILAVRDHAWIIVDAHADLESSLRAGPHIMKINGRELTILTGIAGRTEAAQKLFSRYNLLWLAITEGGREAVLFSRRRQWRYRIPELTGLINPLGAGDTATAALLTKAEAVLGPRPDFADHEDQYAAASERLSQAFHFALAAASASCLNQEPAALTAEAVAGIMPGIEVTADILPA